jgi:FlaA1/EpsC-like NDP-sugar epimerase
MAVSPPQRVKTPRGFEISPVRRAALFFFDGAVAAASLLVALYLRFGLRLESPYREAVPSLVVALVTARLLSSHLFKLQRWSFRFSGLTDGMRVAMSGLLGTGLFMSAVYFLRLQGPPRSVVVLEFFLTTTAMLGIRFSPRVAWAYRADRTRARRADSEHTLIIGAGAAGDMLLRDLRRSNEHAYTVLGFVDDDPAKRGMILGGKPVLGSTADLPVLVRTLRIGTVLIAIPRLAAERIREMVGQCADLKVRYKILPVSFVYLQERSASAMLEDLSPEDLLPRSEVSFAGSEEGMTVRGRRALVTGAAGSIGSEICVQLARAGVRQLVMVDIDENEMYLLQRRLERWYPTIAIAAEVADVRDRARVLDLFRVYRPQDVFHAAAHKQVPLMETAPCEAVKNNVLATQKVAEAADKTGCEVFVLISTDKAVRPTSVMGVSKRLAEKVVRVLADRSRTRFVTVRFGNVLGSAGSVVPLFREQISAGGPVTVTDPEVRRFFMTTSEAVSLVLQAAYGNYGELCILDMGEQIKIVDLARLMIGMSGKVPDVDVPIVFTGLRPGEKLAEELLTEEEERTQRVANKILVAESPAPSADFETGLAALEQACDEEDAPRVRAILRRLVPSYRPISEDAAEAGATAAGPHSRPSEVRRII